MTEFSFLDVNCPFKAKRLLHSKEQGRLYQVQFLTAGVSDQYADPSAERGMLFHDLLI